MGSSSAIDIDRAGNIWVADRCGANKCVDSPLAPIMKFDSSGKLLASFGAGMFVFPHGITIDRDGNVWVSDGQGEGQRSAGVQIQSRWKGVDDAREGRRSGRRARHVQSTFGRARSRGTAIFLSPMAMAAIPTRALSNSPRTESSSRRGERRERDRASSTRRMRWRSIPRAACSSATAATAASRSSIRTANSSISGRSSAGLAGCTSTSNDVIYVSDSESREKAGYGNHPGWKRGIRVGSAKYGSVASFIPNPDPNPDATATSGAEGVVADASGAIYGAEVGEKDVKKYVKK